MHTSVQRATSQKSDVQKYVHESENGISFNIAPSGVKTGLGYSGFRQFKGQNPNLSATCGIFSKKHVWEYWRKFPCLLLVAEDMKYSALAGGFVLALILIKGFRDHVVTIEVF